MLALVRKNATREELPHVSQLSAEEKVKVEDQNVRKCIDMGAKLGL